MGIMRAFLLGLLLLGCASSQAEAESPDAEESEGPNAAERFFGAIADGADAQSEDYKRQREKAEAEERERKARETEDRLDRLEREQ